MWFESSLSIHVADLCQTNQVQVLSFHVADLCLTNQVL